MKKLSIFALVCMFLAGCATTQKTDQIADTTDTADYDKKLTVFVLDISESMLKDDKDSNISKIFAAKENIKDLVLKLDLKQNNLSLINFGGNCEVKTDIDTTNNVDYFNQKLNKLQANGYTPLAAALKQTNDSIKDKAKKVHIVLLSDGLETCGGNPKAEAQRLVRENPNAEISTFILGYDVDDFAKRQLESLIVGNGKYYDVKDTNDMANALNDISDNLGTQGGWQNGVYNFQINFDLNSDYIKPEFKNNVEKLANYMLKSGDSMEIQGHADNIGNDEYNRKLSQKRADSVKNKLIELGVDPRKIKAVGYGESMPKVSNDSPANRYINRRVEAHIVK